jgi:hypothetical protein
MSYTADHVWQQYLQDSLAEPQLAKFEITSVTEVRVTGFAPVLVITRPSTARNRRYQQPPAQWQGQFPRLTNSAGVFVGLGQIPRRRSAPRAIPAAQVQISGSRNRSSNKHTQSSACCLPLNFSQRQRQFLLNCAGLSFRTSNLKYAYFPKGRQTPPVQQTFL